MRHELRRTNAPAISDFTVFNVYDMRYRPIRNPRASMTKSKVKDVNKK